MSNETPHPQRPLLLRLVGMQAKGNNHRHWAESDGCLRTLDQSEQDHQMKRTDTPQKLYDTEKLLREFKAKVSVIEFKGEQAQRVLETFWPEKFLALEAE